jgi:hypothetical protein
MLDKEKMIGDTEALRDSIGEVCGEGDYSLGVVMTALTALLIDTALDQAEMDPYELIGKFSAMTLAYAEKLKAEADDTKEIEEAFNEKGVIQWLN